MENPIFDGEIHILSKEYGYISKEIEINSLEAESTALCELQSSFLKKYAQYIYDFEKEKALDIIFNKLIDSIFSNEDFMFIYRPPHIASILSQNSIFSLKFKRSKNDNLDRTDY